MQSARRIGRKTPDHRLLVVSITAVLLLAVVAGVYVGPISQDPAYHAFADQRFYLGVPSAWNVVSSAAFVLVGGLGIRALLPRRDRYRCGTEMYLTFFAGLVLVGFGSALYHLDPRDATLIWDRLPMTLAFMGFTALVVTERVSPRVGRRLFPVLLLIGLASVVYWGVTNDLRLYALVQFGPMILLPLVVVRYPGHGTRWLWFAIMLYAAAKGFELYDREVFEALSVSGHTLKHLCAAAAGWMLVRKVRDTTDPTLPCPGQGGSD